MDKSLEGRISGPWTQPLAKECWSRYSSLYHAKHYNDLFQAQLKGENDKHINRMAETFARYARMFLYQRSKYDN